MTSNIADRSEIDGPRFSELYVISDLHLGGPTGFQIFNSGAQLSRLVDHLRITAPDKTLALVINGDFVDFLAESPAVHFDPHHAVAKLDRVVHDPAFAPAWNALRRFTATKNRLLIINLGNHDLELALPWVRAHLLDVLSGDDDAARGRITLTLDGAGFRCRVGNTRVMCVHGNEVDDWNLADYEMIRRLGRDLMQGQSVDNWIPNAGSRLVIEVMNGLKRRYPFVDLLKPEVKAMIPILLALAPDQRDKLGAIGATVRRLAWDKLRRATGFLSDEDLVHADSRHLAPGRFRGSDPAAPNNPIPYGVDLGSRAHTASLLAEVEDQFNSGRDPLSLISSDERQEYLSFTSAVMSLVRGGDIIDSLWEALEQLEHDRSFDLRDEDSWYQSLDEQIGADIDFVVAGHTHLERALPRKNGYGWYFNSGTWARLMRLDKNVLADKSKFRDVVNTLKDGNMEVLDNCPGLVLRRLTVVAVWCDAAGTHGELRRVSLTATEPIFTPVAQSHFVKP